MLLKKISYNARVSELDALADGVLDYWREAKALQSDAVLSAAFAELETLSAQITEATRQGKTASNLGEADAARDEALQDLGDILKGYSKLPLAEMVAAGKSLLAVFERDAADATRKSYLEESALVAKLLQDLDGMSGEIAALPGVAEQISLLDGAQKAFDAARKDYETAQAAEGKRPAASSFAKPILSVFNERLVPYLRVVSATSADYEKFASLVAAEIERVNARVRG